MGITVCFSYKQFILDYNLIMRMKSTLCLIMLCYYLTLSAASIIPDKKDSENDAYRTSHDATEHKYGADDDEGCQPESSVLPGADTHHIENEADHRGHGDETNKIEEDVPVLDYGADENHAIPDDVYYAGYCYGGYCNGGP